MAEQAKISSLDVFRDVKAALAKFAQEVGTTLSGVDADVQRVSQWLSQERPAYWKHEVRRREDKVAYARAAIAKKQISRAPEPASVVEERQALHRAQRQLESAREKADAVRKWSPMWDREAQMCKSSCSGLGEILQRDIPAATARLERMCTALEQYLSITQENAADLPTDLPADSEAVPQANRHAAHRAFAPSAEDRAAMSLDAIGNLSWKAGVPTDLDAEAISRLAVNGEPPPDTDAIVFAWRALDATSVVLTRLPAASPGDSGWCVGPLDRPEVSSGHRKTTIASFNANFPGLASLLSLIPGTVVVLTAGIVRAIIDPDDREIWNAELF